VSRFVGQPVSRTHQPTQQIQTYQSWIPFRHLTLALTFYDLGGDSESLRCYLPNVCLNATLVLYIFNLCDRSTLGSLRKWYRQVRGFNKVAASVIVGNQYDLFLNLPSDEQVFVTQMARKFALSMRAPLVFCSTTVGLNVQKTMRIAVAQALNLDISFGEIMEEGAPLVELYQ